jgi:uncharacterized protein
MRPGNWAVLCCLLTGFTVATAAPQFPIGADDRQFVRDLHANWYLPQAEAFLRESAALHDALDVLCRASPGDVRAGLSAARAQWRRSVAAWERLSAVRGGALLARRSPREIDFVPTRPESIRRAIGSVDDLAGMERVGAPAKGLPALEWLLWTQAVHAGVPACRYAVLAAGDIAAEAEALRSAYALGVQHGWDDAGTEYALYEFLNLLDAAVQKLWWEDMSRPRHKAATGSRAAGFPRAGSGGTVAAWRARWRGLRALLVGEPGPVAGPSLHAYLAGKGHAAQAQALAPLAARVDLALDTMPADAAPSDECIAEAVAALRALQQHLEHDTADALQFVISFFDEDGD